MELSQTEAVRRWLCKRSRIFDLSSLFPTWKPPQSRCSEGLGLAAWRFWNGCNFRIPSICMCLIFTYIFLIWNYNIVISIKHYHLSSHPTPVQLAAYSRPTMIWCLVSVWELLVVLSRCWSHASAQSWTDIEVVDLKDCSRGAIKGKRPNTVRLLWSL